MCQIRKEDEGLMMTGKRVNNLYVAEVEHVTEEGCAEEKYGIDEMDIKVSKR
ncbi:hypothetical protein HHI36_011224 [Cryptolaemus montrouzieri]|uniref:Uncharacterized protein n=1 Tax=Cryptolaemus montrouzieri TaxID=559131 RepID=A0ABD2ML18_9CUCU